MTEGPRIEREPPIDNPEKEPKEFVLQAGDTVVKIIREGALVTSFEVGEHKVFMPDQEYPDNGKRRGGNPLLFPNAGPLTEEDTGKLQLPQHGFARDREWTVEDYNPDDRTMTLSLSTDDETRKQFPYDFELRTRITVAEGRLTQELEIVNNSEEEMPVAPGFHPYFNIPAEDKPNISTNIDGFDPPSYDWKTPLVFDRQNPITLTINEGTIEIQSSDEFRKALVWSEPERPQVCIEPWTGDVDAILHEEERVNIQPGESAYLKMSTSFTPNKE